ncbi:MAG TPA: diguanylate cyclase [Tepidisphaeraceae bacterium]|jgi:diguanylate cyclase (GGDEF)-like protein|nr:diguanylate cyclase [Tepidisphaeraceae bacterium]
MQQQILVIDDSKTIHPLVKVILAEEPVEVHSAMDAKYGMVLAASVQPDLILLDVDMPGMDGFEACKQLKSDPQTADVPIIFLTSHSSVAEKVRGLGLGAMDYVTKPFNRAELMARVRASLRTKQSIRALEEKATIDSLTGLGNRAMFDQRLEAEVCLQVRTRNPLACILMDVDRFKRINDTFGHPAGDKVLKQLASIIADMCRTEDVACRYGGEEFAILAPNTTAIAASTFAERLRAQISKATFVPNPSAFIAPGTTFGVTASFGVADSREQFDRSMVQRADDALYQSKRAGRDRVSIADSSITNQSKAA